MGIRIFAHFFPLLMPCATCAGPAFTVVFTNVQRERLSRCSLPLMKAVHTLINAEPMQPEPACPTLDAALRASLIWFRCHDLGHFWRRVDWSQQRPNAADPALSAFEVMALEETYADMLGLLGAWRISDATESKAVFVAEMVRYLARVQAHFADSLAAAIEAGWLANHGLWLTAGSDCLTDSVCSLVRAAAEVRWCGEPGNADLEKALLAGQALPRIGCCRCTNWYLLI